MSRSCFPGGSKARDARRRAALPLADDGASRLVPARPPDEWKASDSPVDSQATGSGELRCGQTITRCPRGDSFGTERRLFFVVAGTLDSAPRFRRQCAVDRLAVGAVERPSVFGARVRALYSIADIGQRHALRVAVIR